MENTMSAEYIGRQRLADIDAIPLPRLATLPWREQDRAYRLMWSVATSRFSTDNQVWIALDAIVRIWGDRDAQILLDGYIPQGRFNE
jgi:hypothetical protein